LAVDSTHDIPPYELEFLVIALGRVAAAAQQREIPFAYGLNEVADILETEDLRRDPDAFPLHEAIRTFGIVARRAETSLEPLRSIWKDEAAYQRYRVVAGNELGRLIQGQLGDPELEEILTFLRDVLERYREDPAPIDLQAVMDTLSGYAYLARSDDIDDLLFFFLLDESLCDDAIRAVLGVVCREWEDAGDVVNKYLKWRVTVQLTDHRHRYLADNCDQALVGFGRYADRATTAQKEQAAKAVASALAASALREDDMCTEVRQYAAGLLKRLVIEDELPKIDPAADPSAGKKQLEEWSVWWDDHKADFGLNGDALMRRPQ